MMRFGRLALITVATLVLVLLPCVARAQRFVGIAGGTNVAQGPALPFQDLSAGVAGQVSMGYRVTPRLRLRFDALVSHFTAAAQAVTYPTALPTAGSRTRRRTRVGSFR